MRYLISAAQPRHLSIKLCHVNLFRIKNLIKSNRQNKLKLGVESLLVWGCGGELMRVVMGVWVFMCL